MSKTTSKALVTLTTLRPELKLASGLPISHSDQGNSPTVLDTLIDKAIQQHLLIKQGERDGALRAIFLGLLFWQIKNECPHGKFMKLASDRMPEIPTRTRSDYMSLARVFVEKSRVALPERFDIPDAQLALGGLDEAKAEIVEKAMGFIGELSIHELMIKHDIRAVGLKKKLGEGDGDEGDDTDANLPPDEVLRRKREEIFGQTAEHLTHLRKTITDTEQLAILQPDQIDVIKREVNELKAALDQISKS